MKTSCFIAVKESEDKENLQKRTQTGSFKFTFSHSTGNNDKAASSASPASSNGSSGKGASAPTTPVVKVGTTVLCLSSELLT